MEKGSETYEHAQQNGYINDFTEKSKSALTTVGGAVTGLTTVRYFTCFYFMQSVYQKFKTILVEEEEDNPNRIIQ